MDRYGYPTHGRGTNKCGQKLQPRDVTVRSRSWVGSWIRSWMTRSTGADFEPTLWLGPLPLPHTVIMWKPSHQTGQVTNNRTNMHCADSNRDYGFRTNTASNGGLCPMSSVRSDAAASNDGPAQPTPPNHQTNYMWDLTRVVCLTADARSE